MSPQKPKILASSIPNITALREQLDYGDPHSVRCKTFYDDARAFRQKYRTKTGVAGASLHTWNSPEHQAGLTEMTNAYLEDEGNGALYWPDDDVSLNYNKLRYSREHDRRLIKRVMKQLFFRLNQQQYRNIKYKKKDQQYLDDLSRYGSSPDHPIEIVGRESSRDRPLNLLDNRPLTREGAGRQNTGVEPAEQRDRSQSTFLEHSQQNENKRSSEPPTLGHGTAQPDDIYEVPDSPRSPNGLHRSFNFPNRATRLKRLPDSDDFLSHSRLKKRAKSHDDRSEDIPGLGEARNFRPAHSIQIAPQTSKTVSRLQQAEESEVNKSITSLHYNGNEGEKTYGNGELPLRKPSDGSASTIAERSSGATVTSGDKPLTQPQVQSKVAMTAMDGRAPDDHRSADLTSSLTPSAGYLSTSSPIPELPEASPPIKEQTDPPKQMVGSRANIEFVYRVVLSRKPIYLCKGWQPKGKFQEKSLADLLSELKLDGSGSIQALSFTLEAPGLHIEEQINEHDTHRFESMKRHFNKQIRACLTAHADQITPLLVEIEIEPLREENSRDKDEIEEVDLVW